MHILYLHQYYVTPKSGAGTRSFEFSKRFAAAGHKVTVLTGFPLGPIRESGEVPDGVEVISTETEYGNEMAYGARAKQFVHYAQKAVRLGRSIRPDIIFATSTPLTVGWPAMALSRKHGIPFVFEVRDLWPEAPRQMGAIRNPLLLLVLQQFERQIYRRAAHVIALSPGMVEGVRAAGTPAEKISMIPNAADLNLFKPGPLDTGFLARRGLPLKPTISYAGALGAANGIGLLLRAAALLKEQSADLQIVIAGDGARRAEVEDAISRQGLTNLVCLGAISKHEVVALFQASMAGLVLFEDLPILQTNSPNKFFDLLAAGRPVVTNMTGWVAEMSRRHNLGFVLPNNTPAALADAIKDAAANPGKDEMGANARALGEREFDRDKLAAPLLGILERVAREGRS